MTTSNRFGNRLLLALLGLIVLAAGVGAVLVGTWDAARSWFGDTVGALAPTLASRFTPPDGVTVTAPDALPVLWPLLVIAAFGLVVAIVCVVLIFRRGHGRTGTVLTDAAVDGPAGAVTIGTGFAQSALQDALRSRPDILSVSVSAYRHRAATALKVRVLPRGGVSPRAVVDSVRESVLALDELLGARLPVVLEIASSTRASVAREERVQ
ncbi:hypothetical protein HQQ81_04110 [Microbacteriaceae bacterium VKM Ac-2854]|nr:hypothetical protein [Microbacteriaceae bacterium VKM Ac-2854]